MDLILTLLPPIAAVFLFIYMQQQKKAAQQFDQSLFPDLKYTDRPSQTQSPRQSFIDIVHLFCVKATWIPAFFRVYFLGIFEFVINAIEKFILPNPNGSKESQIQDLIDSARGRGDLKGKLAVITGGDSGIGCELAKALIECDMDVIITGRSERTLQQAAGRIRSAKNVGHDRLKYIILELSSFGKVVAFTKELKESLHGRSIDIFVSEYAFYKQEDEFNTDINIMIDNAGVMNCPFEMTDNKLEYQSQVNCFATILTTLYILPLMSTKSRIITTSSSTLYAANHIDISKFFSGYRLDGLGAYAQSKLSLALLTNYLSERIQSVNSDITINSCHPGIVNTSLFQYSTVFTLSIFRPIFRLIMLSPREGILSSLHLCLDPSLDSVSGEFWLNQLPRPLGSITMGSQQEAEESQTVTIQRWLWQTSLDIWSMSEDDASQLFNLCREQRRDTEVAKFE
ncbi:hypothetical protein INT43_006815 [Umbelopsis isabellina]|uniref:NAD(P)-binding protein n=1 Tax=Mortierella isabellina TaxID=91625 RepID=A0A8H7UM33_MORIS|nr:hypothetical protein INT43_006815 [Umbelopsis isabellina]